MSFSTACGALLLTLLTLGVAHAGSDVPTLEHNPFTRPDLVNDVNVNVIGPNSSQWPHVLQATLVAGAGSLANVDGQLVGIGEEISGYVLLEIGEGTAIFSKNNVQITVEVGDKKIGDDDE